MPANFPKIEINLTLERTVLGLNIAKLRLRHKLTQKQLSKELDISRIYLAKLEMGTTPSLDLLIRIADYFQVSLDDLIGRKV